jgi:hypothetical protein
MIVGHTQAEIHVPLMIVEDDGGMRDASVVLTAKVDASADSIVVKDFLILEAPEDLHIENIKRALREGWAPISNAANNQPLQQACLAGL